MKLIIFLGPPGCGKGSLSQMCVSRLGWAQLSTGNILRDHIDKKTEIGRQIDLSMKSGKLISDDLVVSMVENCLKNDFKDRSTVILDGFPRTLKQAHILREILSCSGSEFDFQVVRMNVSDDEIIKRILLRIVCSNVECQQVYSLSNILDKDFCISCKSSLYKRSDDNESVIRNRLQTYRKHEDSIVSFYKETGCLVKELDVSKSLEEVYGALLISLGTSAV